MFTRSLCAALLVPVLAAMLVLTTPVGTGGHEHQDELLHPVLPHAHLIDGRIVSDEQQRAEQAASRAAGAFSGRPHGPALGAGDGADADGFGMGLVPTLPVFAMKLPGLADEALPSAASARPRELREAPEDPPPNAFV